MASRSHAQLLRTIAQYQLALAGEDDLSDDMAADLARVRLAAKNELSAFLTDVEPHANSWSRAVSDAALSVSSSMASIARGAGQVFAKLMFSVLDEMARQQVRNSMAEPKPAAKAPPMLPTASVEVHEPSQAQREKFTRVSARDRHGCEEDEASDEPQSKHKEKKKKTQEEESDKTAGSASTVLASLAVAGIAFTAASLYQDSQSEASRLDQVVVAREGRGLLGIQGDQMDVSVLNTGRLVAADATVVVEELQLRTKGLELHPAIASTASEARRQCWAWHDALVLVESERERRLSVTRLTLASVLFSLFGSVASLFLLRASTRNGTIFGMALAALGSMYYRQSIGVDQSVLSRCRQVMKEMEFFEVAKPATKKILKETVVEVRELREAVLERKERLDDGNERRELVGA